MRRIPSYFIAGYYNDPYFVEQLKNEENIEEWNDTVLDTKKHMSPRFIFVGNPEEDMIDIYDGSPFSVYLSESGDLRLFLINDGKLSIKRSSDYVSWEYDIYEQIIHKDFVDEKLNKGFPEGISNIQIVRDDYNNNVITVLYFHNKMLFMRHFFTYSLSPLYNSDGTKNDSNIKRELQIVASDPTADPPVMRTTNCPIFLVGVIPDSIKAVFIEEIQNDISPEESKLFIRFPYTYPDNAVVNNDMDNLTEKEKNEEMVKIFNDNFELDTDTQVCGYTTAKGLMRVFYKDIFGNIDGIIIDGLNYPTLEVMNTFKGSI